MRIDRLNSTGQVREHSTDDGVRTLCGLSLDLLNARLPTGGLSCARCRQLDRQRRLELAVARTVAPEEIQAAWKCVTATLGELDRGHIDSMEMFSRASALRSVANLADTSRDVRVLLVCLMAAQVIRGVRALADLRALCESTLRMYAR